MAEKSSKKWLRPFLDPLKPIFREVLVMSLFVNILALAVPVFTLQVYDRVVASAGISTLWGLLIGMVFVVIFDVVLKQARSRVMQTVALRIDVQVGRQLFDKLMSLPLDHLEGKPASFWQSLFRDVDVVRNALSGASALLLCDLPFVFLFLLVIFVVASPIAWVLLIVLPLFMFVAWRSGNVMASANSAEREATQDRDALIAEMIQGRTTIKALALDRSMRPMWEERHADNIERALHRGTKTDFYSNLGQSLTMMTTVCLTAVGAYMIVNQNLTMGALIATNMLTGRLLGPLNQLVGQWRTYNSFRQSVARLGEIFSSPSERQESELKMDRPTGELTTENLTFAYGRDMKPVVDSVSVRLKARGIHALVGRNGSGKTTLLKLLQGLYTATSGRVLLDGADIAQFTRSELATWMGYVPQECVLFAGSVRDNIVHRFPDANDEEIVHAATQAGVHHFIIDLPDGYATDIGEAGRRLSGGQRQRIAIARALLGDPAVLLLDEPSASLDRQAEHELRDTLIQIAKQRTVVIVTHSPILLAACNDLVALDKGKVALAGPAKEILPRLFGQQPIPSKDDDPAKALEAATAGGARPAAQKPAPPSQKPAGANAARPAPTPGGAPRPGTVPVPTPAASKPAGPPPKPSIPPAGRKPAAPPKPAAMPVPPAANAASGESVAPPRAADPSVPMGNMFRLAAAQGSLIDDPYADLIESARGPERGGDDAPPPAKAKGTR